MSLAASKTVDQLRPAFMQSQPVRIDKVFDDPDAVLDLIRKRAPYPNVAEFHNMQDIMGGERTQPWYRTNFQDDLFLHNGNWVQAAKDSFSAEIVKPFKSLLNLTGPMPGGGAHVDLPLFRGFAAPAAPVWLLGNMGASGLFNSWMVPIASGLAWFYRGVGGEFEYWADGTDKLPHVERGPLWNSGVVSDNEFMWHSVGAIGTEEDREKLKGKLDCRYHIYAGDGDSWEIRDVERVVVRLPASLSRISLLWKAYVFRDKDHLASFENRDMDLTLDKIVGIYADDLESKGIAAPHPTDPLSDSQWRKALEENYPSPFIRQANGDDA